MKSLPEVDAYGFWFEGERKRGTPPDRERVDHCKAYIVRFLERTPRVRTNQTSYGYKHTVERWLDDPGGPHVWIGNGDFIQAAIELRAECRPVDPPAQINAYFALAPRSARSMERSTFRLVGGVAEIPDYDYDYAPVGWRFALAASGQFLYVAPWRLWLVRNGDTWAPDTERRRYELAAEVAHAIRTAGIHRVRSLESMIRSAGREWLAVSPGQLEPSPAPEWQWATP